MDRIMVTQSSLPGYDEYINEIRELWDTHWLTNMGTKHERLRKKLAEYLEVQNIDLLTNGHMALELSMQAMRLTGEVITSPFTFASTTHAIIRSGLEPVFCDIDPLDFTIDADQIEGLITERTCAILPIHVYGNICNIEKIERIAQKYKLKVIYDAAHAFGIKYQGKGIGGFGDASCFSFHATKVFNTVEGGAVCFKSEEFGHVLYGLKNFGILGPEEIVEVGANAKMNEFCAAMGLCNLRHIDEEIAKRKRVFERYKERLAGVRGLRLNIEQKEVIPNYAYFPLIVQEEFRISRDEVAARLEKNGIYARKYFYPLTNSFECFRGRYEPCRTPIAMETSRKVLTLPLYADLSIEDVDKICDVILKMREGKF